MARDDLSACRDRVLEVRYATPIDRRYDADAAPRAVPGGRRSDFQGGHIFYEYVTGLVSDRR